MEENKKLSSDIIADAVIKYWKEESKGPVPVVVYFCQKHEYEGDWEYCTLYAEPVSPLFDNMVKFDYHFCEGQTEVKNIFIAPAQEVFDFYYDCNYDHIKPVIERM